MLTAQSPLPVAMSPNDCIDARDRWASWRTSASTSDLPTPPSSVPSKRPRPLLCNHLAAQAHCYSQEHPTLPPITHLDRHWPCSSPLTPPDDGVRLSPLWHELKTSRERLHSPLPASSSPFLASPSPSPVDEDLEQYNPMEESYDAFGRVQNAVHDVRPHSMWQHQGAVAPEPEELYAFPEPSQRVADWVTDTSSLSAHFLAEKVCETVCYLWFSSSLGPGLASGSRQRKERERERRRMHADAGVNPNSMSPPFVECPLSNSRTAGLQFYASPEFITFMQKLLETTQVSRSVIVLSLHYIYRLKERNDFTLGKPGSEFRVAVCALMLANKFVDDNTYTNKTWSEVSSIPLEELNKMEREFLLGVDFHLFIDKSTYESWLNLLQGLILAKERELMRWQASRRSRQMTMHTANAFHQQQQQQPLGKVQSYGGQVCQPVPLTCSLGRQHRARSTSPKTNRGYPRTQVYPFTFSMPPQSYLPTHNLSNSTSQSARTSPGDTYSSRTCTFKRTAADAFSPNSSLFANRLPKRPTGLLLDIGAALASSSSARSDRVYGVRTSMSAHPYYYADSIRELERMNLSSTPIDVCQAEKEQYPRLERQEQTLAAPYRIPNTACRTLPPHLYFYALASSPVHADVAWTSASDDCLLPGSPAVNGSSTAEQSLKVSGSSSYTSAADRKARLRFSHVPTQARISYSCTCDYRNDMSASVCMHRPMALHDSVNSNEVAYSASSATVTSNTPVPAPPVRSHSTYFAKHHSIALPMQQQPQNIESRQLPPLSHALSLADPVPHISCTQGACTSPFCGYSSKQDVDLSFSSVEDGSCRPFAQSASSALTAVQNSSWSALPTETIDGVYTPLAPTYGVASPTSCVYDQYGPELISQNGTTESGEPPKAFNRPRRPAHTEPRPAAFANAGPPGVAQFYPSDYVPLVM